LCNKYAVDKAGTRSCDAGAVSLGEEEAGIYEPVKIGRDKNWYNTPFVVFSKLLIYR